MLVSWYKTLSIAGKGSILSSDNKVHRFSSKYVTVAFFVYSCFDEGKKMANN